MMILKIMSVRDSAIDAFNTPFFVPHVGGAARGFADEVRNKDSQIHAHPGDYELFELGSFDNETGAIVMLERPRSVCRGSDFSTD